MEPFIYQALTTCQAPAREPASPSYLTTSSIRPGTPGGQGSRLPIRLGFLRRKHSSPRTGWSRGGSQSHHSIRRVSRGGGDVTPTRQVLWYSIILPHPALV